MPVTTCERRARTSRRTPNGSAMIEERKQALPADDPELIELSAEAERIARGLVPKTRRPEGARGRIGRRGRVAAVAGIHVSRR